MHDNDKCEVCGSTENVGAWGWDFSILCRKHRHQADERLLAAEQAANEDARRQAAQRMIEREESSMTMVPPDPKDYAEVLCRNLAGEVILVRWCQITNREPLTIDLSTLKDVMYQLVDEFGGEGTTMILTVSDEAGT